MVPLHKLTGPSNHQRRSECPGSAQRRPQHSLIPGRRCPHKTMTPAAGFPRPPRWRSLPLLPRMPTVRDERRCRAEEHRTRVALRPRSHTPFGGLRGQPDGRRDVNMNPTTQITAAAPAPPAVEPAPVPAPATTFYRRLQVTALSLLIVVLAIHLMTLFATILQQLCVAALLGYLIVPLHRWLVRRGL